MNVVIPLALFTCIFSWAYGEMTNQRLFRLAGSIGCIVLSTLIAAVISISAGLSGRFQTSTDLTAAVETYHTHLEDHLKAGRIGFVIDELEYYRTRAHATYEAGGYLTAVAECTERLKVVPSTR